MFSFAAFRASETSAASRTSYLLPQGEGGRAKESTEASAGNVSPYGSFSLRADKFTSKPALDIPRSPSDDWSYRGEPGREFSKPLADCCRGDGLYGLCQSRRRFQDSGGDLWPDSKSSGVYSWVAENGEAYVGQAVSVRRRLLDHWKVHRDILAAAFMRLDRQKLDEIERTCIRDISKNFSTRNIKHAISTSAFVPFDTFMTDAERQVFLFGSFASNEHVLRDLGVLEQKQATKFRRLEREG
jgi:hypothetical protein